MSYRKKKISCEYCKKECNRWATRFCSNSCQKKWEYRSKIELWRNKKLVGHVGKTYSISRYIKKYLFEKYDNKCCKYGWGPKHPLTGNIPLEVNHIDGDASNSWEDNLELICPNCHSLTINFRGLNKNSVRRR